LHNIRRDGDFWWNIIVKKLATSVCFCLYIFLKRTRTCELIKTIFDTVDVFIGIVFRIYPCLGDCSNILEPLHVPHFKVYVHGRSCTYWKWNQQRIRNVKITPKTWIYPKNNPIHCKFIKASTNTVDVLFHLNETLLRINSCNCYRVIIVIWLLIHKFICF